MICICKSKFQVINHYKEQDRPQFSSLKDTTINGDLFRQKTINFINGLAAVGKKTANPGNERFSDAKRQQFRNQNIMIDAIKCFTKIHKTRSLVS